MKLALNTPLPESETETSVAEHGVEAITTIETETETETETPSVQAPSEGPLTTDERILPLDIHRDADNIVRPLAGQRTHSWTFIDKEEEDEPDAAETPRGERKYATFPGTPSDISPPELVSPPEKTEMERGLATVPEEDEDNEVPAELKQEQGMEKNVKSEVIKPVEEQLSIVPAPVTKVEQQNKEHAIETADNGPKEEKSESRTPEEKLRAVEEDYEFIALLTAAAETAGFGSHLVLDHRVRPTLSYQTSMEEIADEEEGSVVHGEKRGVQEDWTVPTPTRTQTYLPPAPQNVTRTSTFKDAVDEFPALSKWQKKSPLVSGSQQHVSGGFSSRRLISYPSNSTISSAVTDDVGAGLHNWEDNITSSQSVSRRVSITDNGLDEATASGQVTPSDLTPTPSTIAPPAKTSTWMGDYITRNRRVPSSSSNQPQPPPSDSGIGDEIASRLSYDQPSSVGYSPARAWEESPRSHGLPGRARTMTFDSSYNSQHDLQRSSTFDSSESLRMSADDSEISDRRERRMRRKQEREAPLGHASMLTREETHEALENRPKSALQQARSFEDKLKFWNNTPDAREIFPPPTEGVRTRTPSPIHANQLQMRRALFDQPPIPIIDQSGKSLKRATTWGPGRKASSPELSAAATSPPLSFAKPAWEAVVVPEPVKSSSPQPSQASPLEPSPSSQPAELDINIDDQQPASPPKSVDYGHIPESIPQDANSWGRKLGKYFRGPASMLATQPPPLPSTSSLDDVDDEIEIAGASEREKTTYSQPVDPTKDETPNSRAIYEEPEVIEATSITPDAIVSSTSGPSTNAQTTFTLPQVPAYNSHAPQATASPLSPEVNVEAPGGSNASPAWTSYFNFPWGKPDGPQTQAQAQVQVQDTASMSSTLAAEETAKVTRDLASESAEFMSDKATQVQTVLPAPLPETPVWIAKRDVNDEVRSDGHEHENVTAQVKVMEEEVEPEAADDEEEEEEKSLGDILMPGGLDPILEEQDEDEEMEDAVRTTDYDTHLPAGMLEPIMEESEEDEYESDIEEPENTVSTAGGYCSMCEADSMQQHDFSSAIPENPEYRDTPAVTEQQEAAQLDELKQSTLTSEGKVSTRRKKKTRKRKSLTGMFGETETGAIGGGTESVKEDVQSEVATVAEGVEESVSAVVEQDKGNEMMGEQTAPGEVYEEREKQREPAKDSPVAAIEIPLVPLVGDVVVEVVKGDMAEVSSTILLPFSKGLRVTNGWLTALQTPEIEISREAQELMSPKEEEGRMKAVVASDDEAHAEEIHREQPEERSQQEEQLLQAGEAATSPTQSVHSAAPKSRLRRLMGKAIKIPRVPSEGDSANEASSVESSRPSSSHSLKSPETLPSPSADTKLPRLARKGKLPKLAKLSEELSLWMKADKKITAPQLTSQSEPSLISPAAMIQRPGSSRRTSTEYPSSGAESESEQIRPLTPTRIPRIGPIRRSIAEPAAPREELPVRHFPATTDDIKPHERRTPFHPSQTIRLVNPDPEEKTAADIAAAAGAQLPTINRFGFRRPPSLSSLASQDRPSASPLTPAHPLASHSTPTLPHIPDTTPSGSTISLGLFKSKTSEEKEKDKKVKKKVNPNSNPQWPHHELEEEGERSEHKHQVDISNVKHFVKRAWS